MSDVNPQKLGEQKREINFELLITLPLLLLSIIIPIAAWHGVFQYDEDVTLWFQRSGSLMVLFSVWAEYNLFKIDKLTKPTNEEGVSFEDFAHRAALDTDYGTIIKFYKLITAILAVIGTVIWGYGDILRGLA